MFFVDDLKEICQMYYDRVYLCEGQKWDLEREVRKRDYEVQEKIKESSKNKKKKHTTTIRKMTNKKKHEMNNARRKRTPRQWRVSFVQPPLFSLTFSLRVVSRSSALFLYIILFEFFLSFTMFLFENTLSGFCRKSNEMISFFNEDKQNERNYLISLPCTV